MSQAFKKLQLNPGLMAALDCFAQPELIVSADTLQAMATERVYVHHTPSKNGGTNAPWSVSMACGMARDILETEELMRLKFLCLRDGLKELGMGGLYERIMGEPIDARQP